MPSLTPPQKRHLKKKKRLTEIFLHKTTRKPKKKTGNNRAVSCFGSLQFQTFFVCIDHIDYYNKHKVIQIIISIRTKPELLSL